MSLKIAPEQGRLVAFAVFKYDQFAEQVSVYKRTNLVKSEKFSDMIQHSMNAYLNGMLTNEEVIAELLKIAEMMKKAGEEGEQLGLTLEESAFYDALTKPEAVKDFYDNDELVAITKELTEALRKNRTIDWQKKRPPAPRCAAWGSVFSNGIITRQKGWRMR